jgi:hypothetical protein
MIDSVLLIAACLLVGVLFVLLAFFATGKRGAFGVGPVRVPNIVDRLGLLLAGLVSITVGVQRAIELWKHK